MSHILLLVLQIVPRLCLSVFLSDAAVLPCSAKHPKVQHCNSLRMCECGSGQGVVSWLYCKGTNWAKRSCRGVEAALTLYVPGLAGRDLWLAVGRCGCSVGVARPNDSSSNTAPYSDSSSMADGMRVGRELEQLELYVALPRAHSITLCPSQRLEMSQSTLQGVLSSFCFPHSPLAWKWWSTANGFLLLTVVTHLITENRL